MISHRRPRLFLIAAAALILASAAQAENLPRYFKLTILHTNDVHGHLLPFDYGTEKGVGGVARRGELINRLRSDSRWPVLVLDAGDIFVRGPLARAYHGEPDFAAMNAIPYDIITLGNNEFKGAEGMDGQRILRERIRQARFPIVCANVIETSTGKPLVPPYLIVEAGGRKIGIFGVTAPRVATYSQAQGLTILDPIATAKEIVPELLKKADVVVALTHIGYDLDRKLAEEVPEIDLIVGGDSHTWLEEPVVVPGADLPKPFWLGGPVIVQDGEWGKCLGRVDLFLRLADGHDYQVMSVRGELLPVNASIPEMRAVNQALEPYVSRLREVVGRLERPVPLGSIAKWTAEAIRAATGADVGAHSFTGVETGLPEGPITRLDVLSVYPYDNRLAVVELTGKELTEFIAAAKPAVAGPADIDPQRKYTLATEDYLLSLWPPGASRLKVMVEKTKIPDVVVQYLRIRSAS